MKNIKIQWLYFGNEHTWSFLPTIQGWYNDFKNFNMGDNYAIVFRFLNKCVGIHICIQR